MREIEHWIVDFDDTLVSGVLTWALRDAIPKLVREHHLPYEESHFQKVILAGQAQASQTGDPFPALDDVFTALGWPHGLKETLLHDVLNNYGPALFEDTLHFLDGLTAAGKTVMIVSNNNRAPEIAKQLTIEHYFRKIFTPKVCGVSAPKPNRDLWDYVVTEYPELNTQNTVIVGDDPWSDGLFSERCGLPCYLVDRGGRYAALEPLPPYRWVRSLLDIPLD